MARPRTISDEQLLDAALTIVRDTGPDSLSFGALAARVDLAGSTLVQRFGTKPNLLRSALHLAWDRLDAATATAIDRAGSGTKGVTQLLVSLSGQYRADDFADQLLILREDLRDPALRARGQAWIAVLTAAIDERVPTRVGHLVMTHWQGTLTMWAFERRRSIAAEVRRSLNELFAQLRDER
jgi:AcrR family transcriptional regulator